MTPDSARDILLARRGLFTRSRMDRTSQAKELIAERRQHFYEEALATSR